MLAGRPCIPPAGDSEGGVRAVRAGRVASPRAGPVPRLVGWLAGRHGGGQPGPGSFQPLGADRGQLLAALPQFQRLLEGEPARFEPFHHAGKLVAGLLVGKGVTICHENPHSWSPSPLAAPDGAEVVVAADLAGLADLPAARVPLAGLAGLAGLAAVTVRWSAAKRTVSRSP